MSSDGDLRSELTGEMNMSGAATNGELSDDADEDVKKGEEGNEEDEEDGEESEDEYEVERILGMRVTKGKGRLFRIRWKGYDSKHDSWEPEENLVGAKSAMDEFLKNEEAKNGSRKSDRTRSRSSPVENKPSSTNGGRKSQRGRPKKINYKVDEGDEDEDTDKDDDFAPTLQKKLKASEKKGVEKIPITKPKGNNGAGQSQSQLGSLISKRLASSFGRPWYDDASSDSGKESPGTSEQNIIDCALKAAKEFTADDSAFAETTVEKDHKSTEKPSLSALLRKPTNSDQSCATSSDIPRRSRSPTLENGNTDDDVSAEISKAKAEKLVGGENENHQFHSHFHPDIMLKAQKSKAITTHHNGSAETESAASRVKFIGISKSTDTGEFLYIGVDERSNCKKVLSLREAHKEDSWSLVKYFQSKIEFLASGEQKVIGDLATS